MAVNGPPTGDASDAAFGTSRRDAGDKHDGTEGGDPTKDVQTSGRTTAPRTAPGSGGSGHNRRPLAVAAIGVTVAAVGVGGFLIGTGGNSSKPKPAPANVIAFHDPVTGVDVSYPASWATLKSSDPTVRLVASAGGPNGVDSVQVRVQRTEAVVGTNGTSITDLRAVTDAIVSGTSVIVLQGYPRPITLNGSPGYYYLYTLTDAASGQQLVHAHYFLFHGHNMISLVFQATTGDFAKLAATFDQVAASLHSNP